MNKIRIFLDVDGVISDWMGMAIKVFNINEHDINTRKILKEEYNSLSYLTDKSIVYETINKIGTKYWEDIELFPWAKNLYSALQEEGDVCFLTSPGPWPAAAQGKINAINRDFGESKIIITQHKYYCANENSILIDDQPSNIRLFENYGGNTFLWPNQYKIIDEDIKSEDVINNCLKNIHDLKRKIRRKKHEKST